TPLNAIIGFAEMLQSEMLGPLGSSKYRDYADSIAQSGTGLSNVLQGLLELSDFEAGAFAAEETEALSLRQALAEAGALQRTYADRAGVALDLRIGDCPALRANKRALKQALLHLIAGAVATTPRGGHVDIASRADGGSVLVTVRAGGGRFRKDDLPGTLPSCFKRAEAEEFSRGSMGSVSSLGLSLLVVSTIGRFCGAELELSNAPNGDKLIALRFRETLAQDLAAPRRERQVAA
ncbi:MAG: HAMP domain-containing histidine kinase, partial [Rhodospirillaceae bacterium]|nr:HAMP domain-containing histidine kinase [Rhodospirillaceae bacterium]